MSHADPAALRSSAQRLARLADDTETDSRQLHRLTSGASEAAGHGPFGPALERFGTAWGATLLSWSLGTRTLAGVTQENAAQMTTATGG